jgi:hypothetical protein
VNRSLLRVMEGLPIVKAIDAKLHQQTDHQKKDYTENGPWLQSGADLSALSIQPTRSYHRL